MANLQVKDIDEKLYNSLKQVAKRKHRSISQEVIKIIEFYLQYNHPAQNNTKEFLKLAGAWKDSRNADEIIADIYNSRSSNKRFSNGIFD